MIRMLLVLWYTPFLVRNLHGFLLVLLSSFARVAFLGHRALSLLRGSLEASNGSSIPTTTHLATYSYIHSPPAHKQAHLFVYRAQTRTPALTTPFASPAPPTLISPRSLVKSCQRHLFPSSRCSQSKKKRRKLQRYVSRLSSSAPSCSAPARRDERTHARTRQQNSRLTTSHHALPPHSFTAQVLNKTRTSSHRISKTSRRSRSRKGQGISYSIG